MSAKEFDMLPVKTRNIMRYFFRQKVFGVSIFTVGMATTALPYLWTPIHDILGVSAVIMFAGWQIFKSEKPLLII